MSRNIILVERLTFNYPNKTALQDISFSIEEGQITALVGPNGAGKSTLMRCLAALDAPFSGQIAIDGIDALQDPRGVHEKVGFLSDSFGLYDQLPVEKNISFIGGCHNLQDNVLRDRVEWVIQTLNLSSVRSQNCASLSRGWRQRVGIGMSIVHKPRLLILDEPASGLDPESRAELSDVLKTLRREGMTILVSSHILAELEEYCTSMLIIREGRVQDNVLLEKHQQTPEIILIAQFLSDLDDAKVSAISDKLQFKIQKEDTHILKITAPSSPDIQHRILKDLIDMGLPIISFMAEERKLQNLYLEKARTKKSARIIHAGQ